MKTLAPCDHDGCPPTRCTRTASDKAVVCKELLGFVERQIAHKIGRKTFSREWTPGHIHDAAMMIQDFMAQKETKPNDEVSHSRRSET